MSATASGPAPSPTTSRRRWSALVRLSGMASRKRPPPRPRRAVVLLSGGLDSSTVLAVALARGFEPHCLSVDYGQRHRGEILAARRVARALGAASHRIMVTRKPVMTASTAVF